MAIKTGVAALAGGPGAAVYVGFIQASGQIAIALEVVGAEDQAGEAEAGGVGLVIVHTAVGGGGASAASFSRMVYYYGYMNT